MSESSGKDTRERILRCAEELFGQRGYEAVVVADIAQACGVSTALIYYHYTDKESLLRALVERASAVFDVHTRTAVEGTGSARERLETFIESWVRSADEHESLLRILVRPLTDPGGPLSAELLEGIGRTVEDLAAVIAEGVEGGEFAPVDPGMAAECLLGLVNTRAAASVLSKLVPGEPVEPVRANADFIVQLFFRGTSA
ncbi:MAG: TetR/AcrR family transcriptional regulator [Anaerosomatales bacterium]